MPQARFLMDKLSMKHFLRGIILAAAAVSMFYTPLKGANPDSLAVERLAKRLSRASYRPTSELVAIAARIQLGTPYVAGLLPKADGEESLVATVSSTDCMLFAETCLDLAVSVQATPMGSPAWPSFMENLGKTRYRAGYPVSFMGRLHYATEWVRNLEALGLGRDISLELGGVSCSRPFTFMSSHPDLYGMSPEQAVQMRAIEETIEKEPFTYIPKDRIQEISEKILPGDIICFVTSIDGLDISHIAIAFIYDSFQGGNLSSHERVAGFIHASSKAGQVVIDPLSIAAYAASRKSCTGIKVFRPN